MITDTEFRFKVSLTRDSYGKKPKTDEEFRKMWFERAELGIDDFVGAIECGYGFSYIYNQQSFHIKYKEKKNFRYTKVLAFDIDDTDCEFETAIANCPYPPSIAYRTYSDGEDGKCSYRFIYLFYDYINSLNFNEIYHNVAIINGFKDLDERVYNQLYFGTDKSDTYVSYLVYDLSDFNVQAIHYNTHTPLIPSTDGTYYTFPDEYYEIKRLWYFDPVTRRRYVRKYTDEGKLSRRKQLYIDGQLYKKINGIANKDIMYRILQNELKLYYDNTVDVITDDEVMSIAYSVMNTPFKCKPCTKHPQFRINVPYWKSVMNVGNNIYKPIVAINHIRKQIKMDIFKKVYNDKLSYEENKKFLEEEGLSLSRRSFYNYKRECKSE